MNICRVAKEPKKILKKTIRVYHKTRTMVIFVIHDGRRNLVVRG